jgi:predicted kinase
MKSFKTFITEGIHDPARRKAIFIAGGPGSGKSYISRKTTYGLGFKHLNSDDLFERGMKKHGLKTTPENIYSPKGQSIRDHAKYLTDKRSSLYIKGKLGLVIDGTGKDPEKIKNQSENLRSHGYDTHIIFVNTSLETALKRNKKRERRLPSDQVEAMHRKSQGNLGFFQQHFGHENMHIVDNDESNEKTILQTHKHIRKIAKSPVRNPLGKIQDIAALSSV